MAASSMRLCSFWFSDSTSAFSYDYFTDRRGAANQKPGDQVGKNDSSRNQRTIILSHDASVFATTIASNE
jgi:hypothetical protein